MKNTLPLTALAGLALAAGSAHGGIILSDSFEEGVAAGTRSSTVPTGWDRPATDVLQGDIAVSNSDRAGVYGAVTTAPGNDEFNTSFGSNAAWIWGGNGGQHLVTNDTGLNHTITEGTTYDLSVNYGGDKNTAADAFVLLYSDNGAGGYSVLASATQTFSEIQDTSGVLSFSWTATTGNAAIGDKLRVRLDTGTSLADDTFDDFKNDVVYDNLSLEATAVPEPSSFALLAGCFGLAWIMVRRRA